MGRIGVSYLDIENAALQLQGRGKTPTVDGIREILGTGSKSTIAQHLRTWKGQQSESNHNLPNELLALVTGLWERLNMEAEQRIIEIENNSEKRIQETNETLKHVQSDLTRTKHEAHQLQESLVVERQAKEDFQSQLAIEQQELDKEQEKNKTLVLQIEDYKSETSRLHQLAAHIQANLEHYQTAMQQLRTEQTLEMEKQQANFQQEISHLKQQNVLQNNQYQKLASDCHQQTAELKHLQEQHQIMKQEYEKLSKQYQEKLAECLLYQERSTQVQQSLTIQEEKYEKSNLRLQEREKQNAVLSTQLKEIQTALGKAEDKIELLRHEKLYLVQEKSELEGHLKQLEKLKITG